MGCETTGCSRIFVSPDKHLTPQLETVMTYSSVPNKIDDLFVFDKDEVTDSLIPERVECCQF